MVAQAFTPPKSRLLSDTTQFEIRGRDVASMLDESRIKEPAVDAMLKLFGVKSKLDVLFEAIIEMDVIYTGYEPVGDMLEFRFHIGSSIAKVNAMKEAYATIVGLLHEFSKYPRLELNKWR